MTYLDTACFVKLYYPEPDSAKVVTLSEIGDQLNTHMRKGWINHQTRNNKRSGAKSNPTGAAGESRIGLTQRRIGLRKIS